MSQQALRALSFGEGDYIANGFGTRHHGDDTIEAKRQATMWRRDVLKRVKHEAEFESRFFFTDVERGEDFALYISTVNTD